MRHLPVELEKAEIIAKKLAKFHAHSYYLNSTGNPLVTTFKEGFFSEKIMQNWEFLNANTQVLIDLTKEWGMEEVSQKLAALEPHLLTKLVNIYTPNYNGIAVLNHGDFHIRNLLFQFGGSDGTTLEDVRFVSYTSKWLGLIMDH